MDFKDYYKILGLEPTADDKAIKTAYRKLARKYHPDVSKEAGAEDKFKEASEAYEVLKSPEKRAEYDDLRKYGQQGRPFQGPPAGRAGAVAVAVARRATPSAEKAVIFPNSSVRSLVVGLSRAVRAMPVVVDRM